MSLEGKNRYLFSYSNKQIEGKKFQYKDFEKTKSYNSTAQVRKKRTIEKKSLLW